MKRESNTVTTNAFYNEQERFAVRALEKLRIIKFMDACYGYREAPFKYGSSLYFEYVGMSRALSAILLSS